MSREATDSAPSHKHATGKIISYKQVMESSHSYCKPDGFHLKENPWLRCPLVFPASYSVAVTYTSVHIKVMLSLRTLRTQWRKCTTVQFILNHQYQMEASGQLNAPDHLRWEMAHWTHQSWAWVSPKPVQYTAPHNTRKMWTNLFIFSSFKTWCQ
jgi:hypothetical protein